MATLNFGPDVDQSRVSVKTRQVLSDLLDAAGVATATISSVCRTPEEQAQAMHDNCLRFGPAYERRVYLPPGQAVIDVFIADVAKSSEETIADMTAKIVEVGPYNVSHHCGDPTVLQVVDLTDSSLGDERADVKALALASHAISKVLDENDVLHLEVPQ